MRFPTAVFSLALAALAMHAQAPQKQLQVLTAAETDPGKLLPPPPADGSDSQTQELAD